VESEVWIASIVARGGTGYIELGRFPTQKQADDCVQNWFDRNPDDPRLTNVRSVKVRTYRPRPGKVPSEQPLESKPAPKPGKATEDSDRLEEEQWDALKKEVKDAVNNGAVKPSDFEQLLREWAERAALKADEILLINRQSELEKSKAVLEEQLAEVIRDRRDGKDVTSKEQDYKSKYQEYDQTRREVIELRNQYGDKVAQVVRIHDRITDSFAEKKWSSSVASNTEEPRKSSAEASAPATKKADTIRVYIRKSGKDGPGPWTFYKEYSTYEEWSPELNRLFRTNPYWGIKYEDQLTPAERANARK
jgi:hypothetical protein